MSDFDAELMQDFLTETGELLEQLDADMVRLESAGKDEAAGLLDSIFRALHTVKGAAGFLGLTIVTSFAHVAEDALNRLRKGEIVVTPHVMDLLLKSVDVLRSMADALAAGEPVPPCPPQLIEDLQSLIDGDAAGEGSQNGAAPSDSKEVEPATSDAEEVSLDLPSQKQDLLGFMVDDLRDVGAQIEQCIETARQPATRADAGEHLGETAGALGRTAEFFELENLAALVKLLTKASASLPDLSEQPTAALLARLGAIRHLVELQADALARSKRLVWPLDTLTANVTTLLTDTLVADDPVDPDSDDPTVILQADGVLKSTPREQFTSPAAASPSADEAKDNTGSAAAPATRRAPVEQTIRVEVSRLEAMLNLVGQLVLTKNRVSSLTRRLKEHGSSHELMEELAGASNDLDRLTGNLQMGVMRTRMQPMAKLFDRYGRVLRDIARTTGKQIELQVTGRQTEVDKSVLELLADPLVHILRNSADHGIETPEVRRETGKPPAGIIRLDAEHQGSHVRVAINDDGRGIERDRIANKAIEKGLATPEQLEAMTDEDVLSFIFAPGFSTAEQISGLSGRGVGMDVVHTNVAKLNGSVHIRSTPGAGTTIEILIPLTVAIMPAMLVGVGRHVYCIPIQSIIEIVRPDPQACHTVNGMPVIRLRDQVLPLIDLRTRLNEEPVDHAGRFAIVVGTGDRRVALVVDSLVGQQEIVIKPLEDSHVQGGPFSGATIREDGDVSLIFDTLQLIRDSTNPALTEDRSAA
ncbi:MAG: chemotaxis protein CheA [Phycisphaeraceae bacterium]